MTNVFNTIDAFAKLEASSKAVKAQFPSLRSGAVCADDPLGSKARDRAVYDRTGSDALAAAMARLNGETGVSAPAGDSQEALRAAMARLNAAK